MKWSKEPPAVDGWWWILHEKLGVLPEIVNVSILPIAKINGDHHILCIGNDEMFGLSEFRGALWAGPITPPGENDGNVG